MAEPTVTTEPTTTPEQETTIDNNIEADTNKINNKYFELIASKGVEGLALVKDCADYFNKTYKKEILKVLRKENEEGKD